jgi:hypothetical protein
MLLQGRRGRGSFYGPRTADRVATVDGDAGEAEITSLAAIRRSLGIPPGIRQRFAACML